MLTFIPHATQGLLFYMVQNIHAHKGERWIFFLNALRISLALTPREGPFHVMFVRSSHVLREPRCYANNVCTCRPTHLFFLDDGVTFGENMMFVLGSYDHFSVFHLFSPAL